MGFVTSVKLFLAKKSHTQVTVDLDELFDYLTNFTGTQLEKLHQLTKQYTAFIHIKEKEDNVLSRRRRKKMVFIQNKTKNKHI